MGTITSITTQKKPGRYNIFVDDKYDFSVSEETLIQFRIAKGMLLDERQKADILAADQEARAMQLALNYLSSALRTTHELREKMEENEIEKSIQDIVIQRLAELKYVDDAHYADLVVSDNFAIGDKGPKRVKGRLFDKGIPPQLADAAIAKAPGEEWATLADRVAQKAVKRNQRRAFNEQKQRIRQALLEKGFTSEQTTAALGRLVLEKDEEHEDELLRAAVQKQWRLKKRYTGSDRVRRVKMALAQKGFAFDAIDAALKEIQEQEDAD